MSELHDQIKAAIDGMDLPKARELLREAMPNADAETFYLASRVALDDEQKQDFLKQAIQLDPFHEKAHAALKGAATVATPPPPAPSIPTTAVPQTPVVPPAAPVYNPSEVERVFLEKHYKVVVTADPSNTVVREVIAAVTNNNAYKKNVSYPFTIGFKNNRLGAQEFVTKIEAFGAFAELVEYEGQIDLNAITPPDGADTDTVDLIFRFSAVGGYIMAAFLGLYAAYYFFQGQLGAMFIMGIIAFATAASSAAMLSVLNKRALKRGYYKSKGL